MDILRPVLDQIAKLRDRMLLMPVIRWGTVAQTGPLRVTLDGDTVPMPLTPQTLVRNLAAGDRVLCVEQHRRVIVTGVAGRAEASGEAEVTTGYLTIPFPEGVFTEPPFVVAQLITGAGADVGSTVMVTNVTAEGFQARHTAESGARTIHWHAKS